jgi:teichuronic acid biosynthesis glycosyltransferase TuaC
VSGCQYYSLPAIINYYDYYDVVQEDGKPAITSGPSLSAEIFIPPGKTLHVLTLTPFYSLLDDDARGCSVAESLPWLERLGVINTVVAVQPFYRAHARPCNSGIPARRRHFFALPGGFGLPTSGVFLFTSLLAEIRRLHQTRPIDVIHPHVALPCGHAAALLSRELKIPFVVTVHGLDAYSTNQVKSYAKKWCKRVSRLVYRSARRVICGSETVRDQVIEGAAAPVNTQVIYGGVDPQIFTPSSSDAVPAVILSVGNLIPIKGHEPLLRALGAIHQSCGDFSWEIIGDGPEQSRLEKLGRELGIAEKIRFLGPRYRSDIAGAMRRGTIFALPSRDEGLGRVYLEAMSAAKPVIACRGQAIEEVIEQGINGCLIDPDDLVELSETLTVLLQRAQLRREMGAAARKTILQGFTLAYEAARLVRLYRESVA